MRIRRLFLSIYSLVLLGAGFVGGALVNDNATLQAQTANRIFEIRTYTAPDGKLADLHKRFRDHTLRIFEKHGMTNVIYFRPTDAPASQNTLIYVIAHKSRDAANKSWADFIADPEWKKVASESQVNGSIVSKVDRVFAEATDYSPMK